MLKTSKTKRKVFAGFDFKNLARLKTSKTKRIRLYCRVESRVKNKQN